MTTTAYTERRELAHRANDGIDVTRDALDAFNHPYAYAATPRSLVRAPAHIASDGLAVATDE